MCSNSFEVCVANKLPRKLPGGWGEGIPVFKNNFTFSKMSVGVIYLIYGVVMYHLT